MNNNKHRYLRKEEHRDWVVDTRDYKPYYQIHPIKNYNHKNNDSINYKRRSYRNKKEKEYQPRVPSPIKKPVFEQIQNINSSKKMGRRKLNPYEQKLSNRYKSITLNLKDSHDRIPYIKKHREQSKNQLYSLAQYKKKADRSYDKISLNTINRQKRFNKSQPKFKDQDNSQTILQIRKLVKQNKYQQAIQTLQKIPKQKRSSQIKYYLGLCQLSLNNYEQAKQYFNTQIMHNHEYSKNSYFLMAICFHKQKKHKQAIRILSKGLKIFPQYQEAILMRARIFVQIKQPSKALIDYTLVDRYEGWVGRADILKQQNKFQESLKYYNKAIQQSDIPALYLKKASCLLNLKRSALFQLSKSPQNSQCYYYKGIHFLRQNNLQQANLSFQQSIKLNDSKIWVTLSLIEMAKNKVRQRDFYEAFYILQRSQFVDIDSKIIQKAKQFIQGVLNLMKRKYQQAIQILQSLKYEQYGQEDKFFQRLLYLYRGYGYFCIGQHKKTLADYSRYQQILKKEGKDVDKHGKSYNETLCKGILSFNQKQYEKCIQLFQKASNMFPQKIQPYFYLSITIIKKNLKRIQQDQIHKSINLLSQAIDIIKNQSYNNIIANLYYHRSILNCYLCQWSSGISDIDKAIEKSQDNIPKYFYLRGLAFGCCQSFKQGVNDLSICINLDQEFADAYLERTKCLQIQGQSNEAFLDLQKYITLKPEDPNIHKYAGHLLFQNGAYQDCILAYSHGTGQQKDPEILLTRAKAYLFTCQFKGCIKDLQFLQDYQQDIQVVNILQNPSQPQNKPKLTKLIDSKIQGNIFKLKDLYLLKALLQFNNIDECIRDLEYSLVLRQEAVQPYLDSDSESQDVDQNKYATNMVKYDLALAYLLKGNIPKAIDILNKIQLDDSNPPKDLLTLLTSQNNQKKIVFPEDNKTYFIFPSLQVTLPQGTFVKYYNQSLKPAYAFPKVDPPEMLPQITVKMLQAFQPSVVDNKPQAPWIRRGQQGIIFTNDIQIYENLQISTEKKSKKQKSQNQLYNDQYDEMFQSLDSKPNFSKLKQNLKLDNKIEQKLNRVLKIK